MPIPKSGGEVSLTKLTSSVGESCIVMSRISSESGLFSLIAGIMDIRRDITWPGEESVVSRKVK